MVVLSLKESQKRLSNFSSAPPSQPQLHDHTGSLRLRDYLLAVLPTRSALLLIVSPSLVVNRATIFNAGSINRPEALVKIRQVYPYLMPGRGLFRF